MPINYYDYLDVLFLYWVEDPTAYEHDDLFYILGVSQLLMIYICLYVLGMDPKAHDYEMFCVERGALEHMGN